LKAGALFIPIRQVARPSVGSCVVLIICVMLSDVNLHYLTLAAHCPVSRCWPPCLFIKPCKAVIGLATFSTHIVIHLILIRRDGTLS